MVICFSEMENYDADSECSGVSSRTPAPVRVKKQRKFNGKNFQRWQYKMLQFLTTLGLAGYLRRDPPSKKDWNVGEWKCKHNILNQLTDSIYGDYCNMDSAKEIWEALHNKYSTGPSRRRYSKRSRRGPQGGLSKKRKFRGKCFACQKKGHKSADCRLPKKSNQTTRLDELTQDLHNINLCAVISEVNLVGANPREW